MNCASSLQTNCTCEQTLNQKIEVLNKNSKEKSEKLDELHDRINYEKFWFKIFLFIIATVVLAYIYKIQKRTKRLKNDLITMRYSNNDPANVADHTDVNISKWDNVKKFLSKINSSDEINTENQQVNTSEHAISYPILIDEKNTCIFNEDKNENLDRNY